MDITVPKGKVYDIQGFSVHDGPGIRTTVFLKGCPLSCLWCHSPESQSFKTQVAYMDLRCVGLEKCSLCLSQCPIGALRPGEPVESPVDGSMSRHVVLDRQLCDDCGKCAGSCFSKALYLCGEDYTVEDVVNRIEKDMPFYRKSGSGGVTVSGGEPMSQPAFTTSLLKACREKGIHTALDTTGFAQYEALKGVLPYTNLFLYDLKAMDSAVHKRTTGVPNELILENARRLASDGATFQLRAPIIPGINDNDEHIRALGAFCASIKDSVEMLQLLPYHKLGSVKYDRLQLDNLMPSDLEPPDDETMLKYADYLKEFGIPVVIH